MKHQPLVLSEWSSVKGSEVLTIPDRGVWRVDIPVITEGASFVVNLGGESVCIGSGRGAFMLCFGASGGGLLSIIGDKAGHLTSLRLPWVREADEAGWHNGPSFTDPNPKEGPQVSREVQAMFETMQRNMLAREARLREELSRKK